MTEIWNMHKNEDWETPLFPAFSADRYRFNKGSSVICWRSLEKTFLEYIRVVKANKIWRQLPDNELFYCRICFNK